MKALDYARKAVKAKTTPKYVKKQCEKFIVIATGQHPKYKISTEKVKQIENILKLLVMPKGLKAGQSLYDCTCGYQWLFYTSVIAVVHRADENKRRYETAVLEICRKNFKTYTVATTFILLFFMEPRFSQFFSVAPDGTLSKEIKDAIEITLKASPLIYLHGTTPRFDLLRDRIEFKLKESKFTPLNYSTNRMDGRLPNVFLADEVGALPNAYPIEAMRSGQINILNKLGCIISTKYPTVNNPFEDEVDYSKRVLDDIEDDETVFALLYEPDNPKNWMADDLILQQSNPVALESPEIWETLLKKRSRAIAVESARENFLTKHCNIIHQGTTESFVDINDLQQGRVDAITWQGRDVYIGVDLAMTNDNCSVSMVAEDDGNILVNSLTFIPEGRVEEKTQAERVNYKAFIEAMKCVACGYKTVDYSVIEAYVFSIEEKYGVTVRGIGYDRFNALSSAQKWEKGDGNHEGYTCVQIRQHSDTLHAPTKLLYEKICNGQLRYEENKLLEINFQNARCVYDTNMNRYVTKKKSRGKVDIVMSIIDAVYLLQQDIIFEDDGFVVQTM